MSSTPFVPPQFGTDGLRGRAGDPPLDPETLRRLGAALGAWLRRRHGSDLAVLLGHDGRASAAWIRDALVQGLASTGMAAGEVGLVTTPALAYLARTGPFAAGIMISASHNPACDNGVKIFGADGSKLSDAAEREIERGTLETEPAASARASCETRADLVASYLGFLAQVFPRLDLTGRTIVCDAANGGGSQLAPAALRSFGARVVTLACAPDGDNINLGSGALHPGGLAEAVREENALLGIGLDGDGDRCILVDDSGTVRDGDEVMFVLARHLDAVGQLAGHTVVATVMSNLGLHRALEELGVSVHTTPVGDRAVVQAMRAHGFSLGGEQSGHIVFAHDDHSTGDGLFTALQVLSLPGVARGATAPLFAGFRRYPQLLLNVEVTAKPELTTLDDVQAEVARVEGSLGRHGRVVLRYSGTENLCRVMVEGPDQDVVRRHAESIAGVLRRALG